MNLLDLLVKIGVKDEASEAVEGVSQGIVGKLGKAATTAAKALAAAFAIKKVVDFGKAAFDAYASFEQLAGGTAKIFDDLDQSKILEDANRAFLDLNMSANDYLESINTVGATFAQTMGDKKAYDTARTGMKAIADFASGTGANLNELNEKYKLISRSAGSYQSIADQFAGILPQTSNDFLEQAKAAGFLKDSYKKLTDVPVAEYQEAVTKMLEKGVEDAGFANNTMKESLSTISGSIAATKSAWQNLVTEIGKPDADIGARVRDMMTAVFGNKSGGGLARNLIKEVKVIARNVAVAMPEVAVTMFGSLKDNVRKVLQEQLGDGAVEAFDSILSAGTHAFETLRGAIEPTLPKLREVASAAGPVISAAMQAGGKAVNAFGRVFDAVAPLLTPLISMLSDVLVDHVFPALTKVLDVVGTGFEQLGEDVSGFVELVEPSVTRLATFVTDVFGAISDAVGGLADFVADPIGTITGALDDIAYSAEDSEGRVSSSMDGIASYIEDATKKSEEAADRYNRKPLKDKTARANVKGNAVDGKAKDAVNKTDKAVKNLKGKTVTVTVNQRGLTAGMISDIKNKINELRDKSVTVTTTKVTKKREESGGAWGGIRYHATGGVRVADRYGAGVPLDVVGERGPEAIVPLTSRYGADFARMMGEEASKYMGGPTYILQIDGIQYNTDEAMDEAIDRFFAVAARRAGQYGIAR